MPRYYNNRPSSSHSNRSDRSIRSNRSNGHGHHQHNHYHQQPRQKFCSFCKNLNKNPFGHTIKECKELQKIECPNCGKNGHTIKYCPFIEKCTFCEKVGHTQDKCFYNPSNNIPKCLKCKKFGHQILDCYFVSQSEKTEILTTIKNKKDTEEKEKKESEERAKKFKEKGFTYDESYLRLCQRGFKENSNFKPWLIFLDSDDEDLDDDYFRVGLNEKEQKRLDDIRYQVSLLN